MELGRSDRLGFDCAVADRARGHSARNAVREYAVWPDTHRQWPGPPWSGIDRRGDARAIAGVLAIRRWPAAGGTRENAGTRIDTSAWIYNSYTDEVAAPNDVSAADHGSHPAADRHSRANSNTDTRAKPDTDTRANADTHARPAASGHRPRWRGPPGRLPGNR